MNPEDKAKEILASYERAKTERHQYERPWQDIRELVRPNAEDFYQQNLKGNTRTERMFDGTAPQALEDLASALHSYMASPTERWFSFKVDNSEELNRDPEIVAWLESVADAIYDEYSDDRTNFNSSLFEAFLDIGAFGNAVLNQEWNPDDECLVFRAVPLSASYFLEDQYGRADKIFRRIKRTKRQLYQQFGEEACPEAVRECKDEAKEWEIVHAVYPRSDRDVTKMDAGNMRYASCWVMENPKHLLKESGYTSFPYAVGRWSKVAGEIYGRGPAIKCLPDIRMLNKMEFTIIKAAMKAVDPPLQVTSDGFLLPIKTGPGDLIFKEPNVEPIVALEHRGNFPIGMEMSEQKREFIRRCFYADWVKLMPKKERQTAYEISELVEQQLRMMAPMLGRMQSELLGPTVTRSYDVLKDKNRWAPMPEKLRSVRNGFSPVYISAAARAQTGSKAMLMGRYLQELIPMAQIDPTVMDAINPEAFAQELALARGVTRRILRTPDEIAAIKDQRNQQQQMMAMAQAAEPASKAVKNLADANQAGNIF